MPGVAAIADTYNAPNYVGELFMSSPDVTPFLSSIGGLTGGESNDSNICTWQTADLRNSGVRAHQEGAAAGTAATRSRNLQSNVLEIHHEVVGVTYSALGGGGMVTSRSSAPYMQPLGVNPVSNELAFQISMALKQVALDVNFAMINGRRSLPSSNASARYMDGLIAAAGSNVTTKALITETALTSSTDSVASTSTAFTNDDKVVFTNIGTISPDVITEGKVYYVVSKSTNAFKVSLTSGGAAITLGTATGITVTKPWTTTLTSSHLNVDLCEAAFSRGASGNRALLVNSRQKVAISAAYAGSSGVWQTDRNVGGVNMQQLVTDFGVLNVILDRAVPQDTIIAVPLDNCAPVFKEIPTKGFVFSEELSRTNDTVSHQLYTEVSLKFGDPTHIAVLRGLAV